MKIEKAKKIDASQLTEITMKSKAYLRYSPQQIELWKEDLTITLEYFDQAEVYKLVEDNRPIGYYSYFELNDTRIKLDNLFLEPDFMYKGYGKMMMDHFLQEVKDKKYESIELDSEPKTENFYKKFGFEVIGQLESSIKDRFLPIMELKIQ